MTLTGVPPSPSMPDSRRVTAADFRGGDGGAGIERVPALRAALPTAARVLPGAGVSPSQAALDACLHQQKLGKSRRGVQVIYCRVSYEGEPGSNSGTNLKYHAYALFRFWPTKKRGPIQSIERVVSCFGLPGAAAYSMFGAWYLARYVRTSI